MNGANVRLELSDGPNGCQAKVPSSRAFGGAAGAPVNTWGASTGKSRPEGMGGMGCSWDGDQTPRWRVTDGGWRSPGVPVGQYLPSGTAPPASVHHQTPSVCLSNCFFFGPETVVAEGRLGMKHNLLQEMNTAENKGGGEGGKGGRGQGRDGLEERWGGGGLARVSQQ